MLQSDLKEAVRMYRLAVNGNESDFEMAYLSDMPTLQTLGADKVVMQLVLDTVLSEENHVI